MQILPEMQKKLCNEKIENNKSKLLDTDIAEFICFRLRMC